MEGFKYFFEQTAEQEENIKKTLNKLPKKHSGLIKGYKIKWQCDNVLDGDDEHVGIINPNDRTITVAAPYSFGREFTFLHEIGHLVFNKFCSTKWKEKWAKIVKKNPNRQKQNDEELWCMCYANHFVKHKIVVHTHPAWEAYMKEFCKSTDNTGLPRVSNQ